MFRNFLSNGIELLKRRASPSLIFVMTAVTAGGRRALPRWAGLGCIHGNLMLWKWAPSPTPQAGQGQEALFVRRMGSSPPWRSWSRASRLPLRDAVEGIPNFGRVSYTGPTHSGRAVPVGVLPMAFLSFLYLML